jgi:hypothetical protein
MPRGCSARAPNGVSEQRCDHVLGCGNPT